MSTHALASLTATYTDSEPEGEEEDAVLQDEREEKSSEDSGGRGESLERLKDLEVEEPAKVTTLVSYNDDAVEEDEEVGEPRPEGSPYAADDVELPPDSTGRISPRILEKVAKLHERMESGLDMNATIQNRKEFRNPSIYEKLIQFCGINELGTNYHPKIYDPLKWGKESYYEELARVQKNEMDKREKEKRDKPRMEVVVGTKKVDDDPKKRKSKWDQVGAGGGTAPAIRPAGFLQSALTGTKSTVISAFGSLPKKPKF